MSGKAGGLAHTFFWRYNYEVAKKCHLFAQLAHMAIKMAIFAVMGAAARIGPKVIGRPISTEAEIAASSNVNQATRVATGVKIPWIKGKINGLSGQGGPMNKQSMITNMLQSVNDVSDWLFPMFEYLNDRSHAKNPSLELVKWKSQYARVFQIRQGSRKQLGKGSWQNV